MFRILKMLLLILALVEVTGVDIAQLNLLQQQNIVNNGKNTME